MNGKELWAGLVLLAVSACGAGGSSTHASEGVHAPVATGRVAVDGGYIYYELEGSGPPLVLIHGAVMDLHAWDDQIPALRSTYRVIRYDLRGFGTSSRPSAAFAAHRYLAALLDTLGVADPILVGSAGADTEHATKATA